MKVIGGRWRGRTISAPRDSATRPTTSRLREALFSAIQPWLVDSRVFDLFAGSGALGIEALSRGAAHAEFVDIQPAALQAVAANLDSLGADPGQYRIRRGDAWRRLETLHADAPEGSLVLLDPPYSPDLSDRCLPAGIRALESGRVVAFAFEHPADTPEPAPLPGIDLRRRRHGHGAFTLLTRSDA